MLVDKAAKKAASIIYLILLVFNALRLKNVENIINDKKVISLEL